MKSARNTYLLLCALLPAGFIAQAQVTCTPAQLTFAGVVVGGASAAQQLTVTASSFSGSVVVQPSSQVQVSRTGSSYSQSPLAISANELAGGKPQTVYVRFAPTCGGFSDSAITSSVILLSPSNELLGSIAVTGVVRQEKAAGGMPFKVATLNAEWLGCPSNGPSNESLQMSNVATLIRRLDADVVALQEVTNNPTKSLDTVLKHLGSAWGGHIVPFAQSKCAQSEAIVYRKSRVSLADKPFLMTNAGTYNAWSSGRYPVEFPLNLSAGGYSIPITLINLHAKAYGDAASYERRKVASQGLKALLGSSDYAAKKLIVLGDYNDDVDVSTYNSEPSPYKNFVDDSLSYRFLSSQISEKLSLIDHIMISDELFPFCVDSAQYETGVTKSIPSYNTTTSDHTPVSATFAFGGQERELPVASHYDVRLADGALNLPDYDADNRPLRYAVDSGVVASLKECTLTLFSVGTVRMVAWQSGDASFAPAAKFFYVQVADRSVAPKIAAQPTKREVALGEAVAFTVQATGTNLRYQWKKDGRDVAGATSLLYAIGSAANRHIGYYSCVVSNDMGSAESQAAQLCVNTMCPTTAVRQSEFESRLKIYPNPARKKVWVESAAGHIASLRVYSLSGAVVYEQKNVRASTLAIPTSSWSAGIYVLTLTSDRGEKAVGKILIDD